jgi:hypothetical protein
MIKKVKPVLDQLERNLSEGYYVPKDKHSTDESLLLWKGGLAVTAMFCFVQHPVSIFITHLKGNN